MGSLRDLSSVCRMIVLYWVRLGSGTYFTVHICCKAIGITMNRSTYSQGIRGRCLERSGAQRELVMVTDRFNCTLPTLCEYS